MRGRQLIRSLRILGYLCGRRYPATIEEIHRHLADLGEECHHRTVRRDMEALATASLVFHRGPGWVANPVFELPIRDNQKPSRPKLKARWTQRRVSP